MSVDVEIQGMKALQKNLRELAKATPRSVVRHAALMVQRSAMIHATGRPGPYVQTGRLHASINIEIESLTSARVGTNVVYAPFVEFGHTQEVGRFVPMFGPGKRNVSGAFKGTYNGKGVGARLVNPTAPAYPFMRPAAEELRQKFPELAFEVSRDIKEITWDKGTDTQAWNIAWSETNLP